MFTYYAVENITINIIIQNKSIIVKYNLTPCLISFLMIIKWLIISELKKLSNYTLRDSKMIIFIKN